MITINKDFFLDNCTEAGSWTKAQLKVLGIKYPLKSGWQRKLYGKQITEQQALEFKEAAKIFSKKTIKINERLEQHFLKKLNRALENKDYEANYNLAFDIDSRIHSMETKLTSH